MFNEPGEGGSVSTSMNTPPPIPTTSAPKRRRGLLIAGIFGGLLILLLIVYLVFRSIVDSGITKGPDNMFGDQHLKTVVALLELHKVRYGKYPDTFRDLKFVGQWDGIALRSVSYYPSADRTRYYVEVQRGWIGKPSLEMPDEFWQGTGYSSSLKPITK
jgi:hypothetical protein